MAHGGTLTTNPKTGLPEAGFLDSILPVIAGIGLNFLLPGVGAAIGGGLGSFLTGNAALASGLLVGGGTAAATGDLGQGLMAGLGAFGGAGAAGSLAPSWTAAAKEGIGGALGAAPTTAAAATPSLGVGALPPADAPTTAAGGGGSPFLLSPAQQAALDPNAVISDTGRVVFSPAAQATQASAAGFSPGETSLLSHAGALNTPALTTAQRADIVSQLAPSAAKGVLGTGLSGMQMAALGLPLLGAMGSSGGKTTASAEEKPTVSLSQPAPLNRQVRFPGPERSPYDSSEFQYYTPVGGAPSTITRLNPTMTLAKGGDVNLEDGAFVVDARTVSELGNGSSSAGADLLKRMGGQHIQGPGDGVSDSIHANIGGQQEARVARDEVKFSPEAVKRVGGGDPKRGASRLYALMHAAQKARQQADRGDDTKLRGLAALRRTA
jgi:hypothetical protein